MEISRIVFIGRVRPVGGIIRCLLSVLSFCLLMGCSGNSGQVLLHQVSGVVACEGRPVSGLRIHFVPKKGKESSAVLDELGRFTLRYSPERDGAVQGTHHIWLEWLPKSPKEEIDRQSGELSLAPETEAILEKYGAVSTTPLIVEIDSDESSLELTLNISDVAEESQPPQS